MKKFRIKVQRTYTTWINVEEKSYKTLEEKLIDHDEDLWDKIYEQEIEQMDIDDNDWQICDGKYYEEKMTGENELERRWHEKESDDYEKGSNTITGALSPDTGPQN